MKNNRSTYIKNILIPCLCFSVITGGVTGIFLFLFKAAASRITSLSAYIYGLARQTPLLLPCLIAGAALLGLIAALILKKTHNCRGGGIPTSIALLRGLIPFNWLHSIFYLFASTMLTFFCGVPLGNEGPSVQMGTAVGRGTVRIFGRKNQAWDRYIMTGGACAGFASATGAPISGIFFAFEEAHRRFSPMIFMTASSAVIASTATTRILCELTNTKYALFGFDLNAVLPMKYLWVPLAVGVVCGICAIFFTKIYRFFGELINGYLRKIPFVLKTVFIFVLVSILGFISADFIGSGHDLIEAVFEGHGMWAMLILCLCVRGILLITANQVGVTGGLFVPSLTFGAIIGGLCGKGIISLGFLPEAHYGLMVAIGMVSFLSASSRTPITAITFAIEALCGLANILPVAIGVTFSFLVIETSGTAAFTESVIENRVEKQHRGKTALTVDAILTVKKGSFVVGKEIRDILWPPTCVVTSVKKNNGHSFATMEEGDVLTLHYKTYDPASSSEALEALLGKQESSAFSSIVTKTAADVPGI